VIIALLVLIVILILAQASNGPSESIVAAPRESCVKPLLYILYWLVGSVSVSTLVWLVKP
jgi:hypothetical protein